MNGLNKFQCLSLAGLSSLVSMFVERKVCYSALFTNLVRCHAGAVSFPLSDVILAQLACPLCDIMFYLHSGITNLSLHKHWPSVMNESKAEPTHLVELSS
jgi:hypothetical protein